MALREERNGRGAAVRRASGGQLAELRAAPAERPVFEAAHGIRHAFAGGGGGYGEQGSEVLVARVRHGHAGALGAKVGEGVEVAALEGGSGPGVELARPVGRWRLLGEVDLAQVVREVAA